MFCIVICLTSSSREGCGEPQLLAVSGAVAVVAVGLVEERMVCLGQQHFENKVVVVVAIVVVKDSTI